jgi:two-component system chemotaxis response regulator CheY
MLKHTISTTWQIMLKKIDIGILLVDDNETSRSMLKHILQSEDYNVIAEANNGKAALDMVEKLMPEIVCLDIMMPDIDGLQILEKIKACAPDTIVMMVTGNNSKDAVLTAVARGAVDYIIKPFNPATVLRSVALSISKCRVELDRMIAARKQW